jgi:hypothetical protein
LVSSFKKETLDKFLVLKINTFQKPRGKKTARGRGIAKKGRTERETRKRKD